MDKYELLMLLLRCTSSFFSSRSTSKREVSDRSRLRKLSRRVEAWDWRWTKQNRYRSCNLIPQGRSKPFDATTKNPRDIIRYTLVLSSLITLTKRSVFFFFFFGQQNVYYTTCRVLWLCVWNIYWRNSGTNVRPTLMIEK